VAQVVECLPIKCEAQSSNSITAKKKKESKEGGGEWQEKQRKSFCTICISL
jgi:hypothetical protein